MTLSLIYPPKQTRRDKSNKRNKVKTKNRGLIQLFVQPQERLRARVPHPRIVNLAALAAQEVRVERDVRRQVDAQ